MADTVLRYRQPRDIKKVFTDLVNKIFALNKEWANDKVEVISLSGDNSPKAYEQFPWDNENYPIVVLFSQGGNADLWGIDSFIANSRQSLVAGSLERTFVTLSDIPTATEIRLENGSMTLKSARIRIQNFGLYEENITLKLWSSISDIPDAPIASGSILGRDTRGIEWLSAQMLPAISLTNDTNYFLSAQTDTIVDTPSGSYYWFIDNDVNTKITPNSRMGISGSASWDMTADSSPIAEVFGPSVKRLGGGIQSTIRMFIEAKDLSTVQKISELIFVYLHLARHSNAARRAKLTNPNVTSMDFDFVSDLSDEGIYIIDVNRGAETVRVRGNDRLFSTDLSITCYSHWTEDFVLPALESLDFNFSSI